MFRRLNRCNPLRSNRAFQQRSSGKKSGRAVRHTATAVERFVHFPIFRRPTAGSQPLSANLIRLQKRRR